MPTYKEIMEGSYVHSKGELTKAIKGSKRQIVKAFKRGDKKEMKAWMDNKKDAEEQLGEETIVEGIRRAVRLMNKVYKKGKPITNDSTNTKAYADFIGMQSRHAAKQARRGGASEADIKGKTSADIEKKITGMKRFQDAATVKRQEAGYKGKMK